MQPDRAALLFDLDDTLYPLRDFVLSGFRAVAEYLATTQGLEADEVFGVLAAASRQRRGRELQTCIERFALHTVSPMTLLQVHRQHVPSLSLPTVSRRSLAALRPAWAIGLVTNGNEDLQARKIAALGLAPLVDTVVFASSCGSRAGKPDPAGFVEALRRLGTTADRAVVIGNDPACDIEGARRAGIRAVLLTTTGSNVSSRGITADACVTSLTEVGLVATRLLAHAPSTLGHGHAA